jgi:senataxin
MQQLVEEMQNGALGTSERADAIKENILQNAKIIVSTLNYSANNTLVSIKKQESIKFLIVDEGKAFSCLHFSIYFDYDCAACQSLEADCLLPFYFGCSKIILVGDPKQLPPCVLSIAGQGYNLSQSLYTRLDGLVHQDNISLLNIQYRMHEEICHFPNNHFYNGELITHPSAMNYWPEYLLQPYYLYNLIYTEHTRPPNGGSSDNREERIFIKKFCIELLECLVGRRPYVINDREFIEMEKRMVVITPYKKQMTKFRERPLQFPRHIEVMTVDSAQGKEKDIVLISCVRSGIGSIGFLNDRNRLNVMLTRAKRALYIFGNLTWLAEQDPHWDALVEDAGYRQVIDTVHTADEDIDLPF